MNLSDNAQVIKLSKLQETSGHAPLKAYVYCLHVLFIHIYICNNNAQIKCMCKELLGLSK